MYILYSMIVKATAGRNLKLSSVKLQMQLPHFIVLLSGGIICVLTGCFFYLAESGFVVQS